MSITKSQTDRIGSIFKGNHFTIPKYQRKYSWTEEETKAIQDLLSGKSSVDDIREILRRGADKVSINTSAVKDPALVSRASKIFGSQCIVVAVDAKYKRKDFWEVYLYGGRTPTGMNVVDWAKEVERLGGGEILLTSMDKDGTKDGYDIELTAAVTSVVNIPVIASGGAGKLEHLRDVIKYADADAVLVASIFHYGQNTIKEAKEYLKSEGINVRI